MRINNNRAETLNKRINVKSYLKQRGFNKDAGTELDKDMLEWSRIDPLSLYLYPPEREGFDEYMRSSRPKGAKR